MAKGQEQRIIIPPPVPGTPEYYSYKRQNRELLPAEKKLGMVRDFGYKYRYKSNDKKYVGISLILYLLCFLFMCFSAYCVILPKPEHPIIIELSFGNPESNITDSIDIELSGTNNNLIKDNIGNTTEQEFLLDNDKSVSIQQVQGESTTEPESFYENSFDSYLEFISKPSTQTNKSDDQLVSANSAETIQEISSSLKQAVSINNAIASKYGSGDSMELRLTKAGAQTGEIQISLFWNTCDDIDLHVYYTPGNGLCDNINWQNRYGQLSKGILDVDMNAQGPQNLKCVENVFWPYGSSPRGFFVVKAQLFKSWSGNNNVPIMIRIKKGDTIETFNDDVWNGASPSTVAKFSY